MIHLLPYAGTISHDAAMAKASEEHQKPRQKLLNDPTEVEKHFVEAEKELKQIEKARKRHCQDG